MQKDYYLVLGVSNNASSEEINRAYRRLVRLWHPDVNPERPGAEEHLKRLNEAYQTLKDPGSRACYDSTMHLSSVTIPTERSQYRFTPPKTIADRRRRAIIPLIATILLAAAVLYLGLNVENKRPVPMEWMNGNAHQVSRVAH